jgi:hypothetical protein
LIDDPEKAVKIGTAPKVRTYHDGADYGARTRCVPGLSDAHRS